MINAIIVDDEKHCQDTLSYLIRKHCQDLNLLRCCSSAMEARAAVDELHPDLVFLDIEMPHENGFQLLEKYTEIPFAVIFTTSYDQYAIRAIHISALDYLLKPIDPQDLVMAIQKYKARGLRPAQLQLDTLMAYLHNQNHSFTRLAIPTSEGFEMISHEQVVRFQAEDNYTHIYLKDKKKIIACRTLKDMEETLKDWPVFKRVHHSHIVNLNEVIKYVRGEGGYLVLTDGSNISVSRSRKDALLRSLERM